MYFILLCNTYFNTNDHQTYNLSIPSLMKFTLYKVDDRTYLKWRGEYTRGESWCRGSHVDFRPSAGLIFPIARFHKCGVYSTESLENAWYEDNETYYNIHMAYISLDILRAETPTSILEGFSKTPKEELKEEYEYANVTYPDGELYADLDTFISFYKKDEILKELEEVEKYGRENGVTFHWI